MHLPQHYWCHKPLFQSYKCPLAYKSPQEFVVFLSKAKQWFYNFGIPRYDFFVITNESQKGFHIGYKFWN
jgi:hypothetical protein